LNSLFKYRAFSETADPGIAAQTVKKQEIINKKKAGRKIPASRCG
jgi:hypothetical protein